MTRSESCEGADRKPAPSHYVILCGCEQPQRSQSRVMYEPVDGRHVIAVIDDFRPDGPVDIEQNPPEDFGYGSRLNRRGDNRQSFNLRCAGCDSKLPRIMPSVVVAVLDRIVAEPALVVGEIARCGWTLVTEIYEGDTPASGEDEALIQARFDAELNGETYAGPEPQLVRVMRQRYVIPWTTFMFVVTKMARR